MTFINNLFGSIIGFFYDLFNDYTLALLFFTLVFQILLLPLAIKQQKNSIKQASLAPKIAAIRKKYAGRNDQATQQKMQQETMEVYQEEGFNPAGGCLPLLIQLPIIMILFNVVRSPLQYILKYSSETITAVRETLVEAMVKASIWADPSQSIGKVFDTVSAEVGKMDQLALANKMVEMGPDTFSGVEGVAENFPNFDLFGMDLTKTPAAGMDAGEWWFIIIPIVTFIAMYGSTWISRKLTYQTPEMKAQQKSTSMRIMNIAMPLMSVYFSYIWSASMGVYWIMRNIFTTLQQIVIAKAMPTPVFTEEDYKAAERELAGKAPKKKNNNTVTRDPNAPRPRSLHYIDADDDDEAPAVVPAPKKNKATTDADESAEGTGAAKKNGIPAEGGPVAPAPLKDDDNPNKN